MYLSTVEKGGEIVFPNVESFLNSWDEVCAPAAKDHEHNSDLDSMNDEYTLAAACFPENKQPQSEDYIDSPDGETNLQSEPLSTEQPSSNDAIDVVSKVHTTGYD